MGRVVVCAFLAVVCVALVTPATGQTPMATWPNPGMFRSAGCDGGQVGNPVDFKAYVGWLEHARGSSISYDYDEENLLYVDRFPLSGVWTSAQAHARLTDRTGFTASGGILIPSLKSGLETEEVNAWAFSFGVDEITWGYLEGSASYEWNRGVRFLAGFRWDKFSCKLDYDDLNDFLHFTLNTYIPVVGLEVGEKIGSSELTVRAVGWPGPIGGEIDYNYVWPGGPSWEYAVKPASGGSFLEFFAEYSRDMFGSGSVGLFGKWTALDIRTPDGSYQWRNGGTGTNALRMVHRRQAWVVGASLNYNFDSGLPNWRVVSGIF